MRFEWSWFVRLANIPLIAIRAAMNGVPMMSLVRRGGDRATRRSDRPLFASYAVRARGSWPSQGTMTVPTPLSWIVPACPRSSVLVTPWPITMSAVDAAKPLRSLSKEGVVSRNSSLKGIYGEHGSGTASNGVVRHHAVACEAPDVDSRAGIDKGYALRIWRHGHRVVDDNGMFHGPGPVAIWLNTPIPVACGSDHSHWIVLWAMT